MLSAFESALIGFIQSVYQSIGWPGVLFLMTLEPLPSEAIMALAGWFLVADQGLGLEWVFVAGTIGAVGNTIGASAVYWMGRIGGRPLLERYGKYLLISHRDLDNADRWFAKYGEWMVLIGRLIPVVRSVISLPAGISRMHFGKFLLFTAIGVYPFCVGMAYVGYALGARWEQVSDIISYLEYPIYAALLLLVVWFVWRRMMRRRRQRELEEAGVATFDSEE